MFLGRANVMPFNRVYEIRSDKIADIMQRYQGTPILNRPLSNKNKNKNIHRMQHVTSAFFTQLHYYGLYRLARFFTHGEEMYHNALNSDKPCPCYHYKSSPNNDYFTNTDRQTSHRSSTYRHKLIRPVYPG